MNCKVVLYSILREKLPPEAHGRATLELPEGATLADVIRRLDLPERALCSVNGQIEADRARPLQEGDEVRFFGQIAGGA